MHTLDSAAAATTLTIIVVLVALTKSLVLLIDFQTSCPQYNPHTTEEALAAAVRTLR